MSLLEALLSREAVTVVSLGIAMGFGRACVRVAAGKLRAETAVSQQCVVMLAMLAASWAWTLIDPAGIARPGGHREMPLHAIVPLAIVASLVPLPAWILATACERPRMARLQRVAPWGWALVASVAALSWPLRHTATEGVAFVAFLLVMWMHFVVAPLLAMLASLPVSIAALRRRGRAAGWLLACVQVAWFATLIAWHGSSWPDSAWTLNVPVLVLVAATFIVLMFIQRRRARGAATGQ